MNTTILSQSVTVFNQIFLYKSTPKYLKISLEVLNFAAWNYASLFSFLWIMANFSGTVAVNYHRWLLLCWNYSLRRLELLSPRWKCDNSKAKLFLVANSRTVSYWSGKFQILYIQTGTFSFLHWSELFNPNYFKAINLLINFIHFYFYHDLSQTSTSFQDYP